MRVLLIGNSHTYFNDMPWMLAQLCRSNRIETDVTMLAHGGKGLDFHVKEPEVRFNICYGGYDAVVLQHTAHPMGELKAMENAAVQLSDWITAAGSLPVLYMTWTARRDGFAAQPAMSRVYRELGRKLHCPVAPVGEVWWRYGRMAERSPSMRRMVNTPRPLALYWLLTLSQGLFWDLWDRIRSSSFRWIVFRQLIPPQ